MDNFSSSPTKRPVEDDMPSQPQGAYTNPIDIENFLVIESTQMETQHANADGSVTVPANDSAILVEYEPVESEIQILLHALGAANANGVRFRLNYGQDISYTSESPLGSISDMYSFTKELGDPITSEDIVAYEAINTTGSDIDLAARMALEVVPGSTNLPSGQVGVQ